jgi:hypothetical protein
MTPAPSRRWFRFALQDLFLGITLVTVGTGGLVGSLKNADFVIIDLLLGIWYGSAALIGAGLLAPFRKKTIGAIVGFLLGWPLILLVEHFKFVEHFNF